MILHIGDEQAAVPVEEAIIGFPQGCLGSPGRRRRSIPGVPVPATVEIMPLAASTLRMTAFRRSTMYRSPLSAMSKA